MSPRKTPVVVDEQYSPTTPWQEVERFVARYGVVWRYDAAVPVAAIDVERSLHNQARISAPVVDSVVDQYAAAIAAGDVLPPLVVHERTGHSDKGLYVVDGNHRRAALARVGVVTHPMFLIAKDTPAKTIQDMAMAANANHGLNLTVEDKVNGALHMIAGGKSLQEASKAMSIEPGRVQAALNVRKADQKATAAGVDPVKWAGLSTSTRVRLAQLSTHEGFKEAAGLAAAAGLNGSQVKDLVDQVNELGPSATKQVAFLERRRKDLATEIGLMVAGGDDRQAGATRRGWSPRAAWGSWFGRLPSLPDVRTTLAAYSPNERDEFLSQLREAAEALLAQVKLGEAELAALDAN